MDSRDYSQRIGKVHWYHRALHGITLTLPFGYSVLQDVTSKEGAAMTLALIPWDLRRCLFGRSHRFGQTWTARLDHQNIRWISTWAK